MKKIVTLLTSLLLVGFISGCGGSDSTASSSGATTGTSSAVQSGVFTTLFANQNTKTWYTEKVTSTLGTVNQAYYSRNSSTGAITITIGARSAVGLTTTNGSLAFNIPFSGAVTTGTIHGTYILYTPYDGAVVQGNIEASGVGNGYTITITQATDDGTVIHIEGSIAARVYQDADPSGYESALDVDFEFDSNSL